MADLTGPNPDEVNGLDSRGASITAKPVLVGARGSTAVPSTVSDGQSVDLWADVRGALTVTPRDGSGVILFPTSAAMADGAANPTQTSVATHNLVFNGTTWDRVRGTAAGGTWVQGPAASDATAAGNPLLNGARGSLAVPTAVSADGDVVALWSDLRGRLVTRDSAGTATLTAVASSASSVTVLAANTGRLGATVWNDSTAILYLKMGATASTTSATVKLAAGAYYEVPYGYTGILDGIWASANGYARVTELT